MAVDGKSGSRRTTMSVKKSGKRASGAAPAKAKKAAKTGDAKNYVVVKSTAGGTKGLYKSRSGPMAAAKKAANRRFKDPGQVITLTLRETGTDREFTYRLTRKKLATPYVSVIKGREIRRDYETHAEPVA